MSNRLKNKTAIVTAAGQGIGKATAISFLNQGAKVLAVDINFHLLKRLKQEYSTMDILELDLNSLDSIIGLFQGLERLDILFNCVGVVHHGSILECNEEIWDKAFNLNARSTYRMIKNALPLMLKQEYGSIINISSVASSIKGVQDRFVYSSTKAAVIGMTKSVATDYVKKGIRCNAICPGTIETPSLTERINSLGGNYENVRKKFVERQPMGRLGRVEEVAYLATYLASEESQFTTGTINIIDGGI